MTETTHNSRVEEFSKKWHELGIPNGCLVQMRDYHHQELQKAREEVISKAITTVLNSRTLEETTGIGVRESTARAQACVDIRTKLLDQSDLDQNKT